MTRIVLVRHGETEWNREERFRGRIDVDLNETGRAQAEACARCGLAVQRLEGLTDIDYGEWHGLTHVTAAPPSSRRSCGSSPATAAGRS